MQIINFEPDNIETQRTYVIFGAPRGGTTMVAGVCRLLGLNIGDNLPDNLEDQSFVPPIDSSLIGTAIASRNKTSNVWGWKYPRAASYLEQLTPALRNPYYICIFRDYLATSRRSILRGDDPLERLNKTNQIYKRNISFISKSARPTLLLSYEKSISDPQECANIIAYFLRMEDELGISRAINFIAPGKYQPTEKSIAAQ